MRRIRIAALAVVIVLLCAGCDWLQVGAGPGHTGANFEPNITKPVVPSFQASTVTNDAPTSEAIVVGGKLIVEHAGTLSVYDPNSYGLTWNAALPNGAITTGGAPAVDTASNTVFIVVETASNPQLLGFDLNGVRNCNTLLYFCTPIVQADIGSAHASASPPAVADGKVFVYGATDLYAFSAPATTNCTTVQRVRVCTPLWSATTGFSAAGVAPAVDRGFVFAAAVVSGQGVLRSFDESSGAPQWGGTLAAPPTASPSVSDDGTVFAPAGNSIAAFHGSGCGSSTCAPVFSLAEKTGDASGSFLSSVAVDSARLVAANGNGNMYSWPRAGCGAACQPSASAVVNAPLGGSTNYSESLAIASGMVFAAGRTIVSGVDHSVLVALDTSTLANVGSWDLGTSGLVPGAAGVSVAWGVVYVPLGNALIAVHPRPVQPLASLSVSGLTLKPAFSPSTFDYVLPCAAGTNPVTFTMAAQAGSKIHVIRPVVTGLSSTATVGLQLHENDAAVIEAIDAAGSIAQYWVRCLPHDFPSVITTPHPGNGSPTPGWYVTGNIPLGSTAYSPFAMILDRNGTPVWYRRPTAGGVNDVTPVGPNQIAYASGVAIAGFGTDPNLTFDTYQLDTGAVSHVKAVGANTDIHEFQTLANGNHIVLSYIERHGVDLTGVQGTPTPGANEAILDCEIQELNPQGQIVFKWDALDHFDPKTETPAAGAISINGENVWDVFHFNSVDVEPNNNLIVSARAMSAVFEINRPSGTVTWKLGGTPVNKDGAQILAITGYPQHTLSLQHDARRLPNGDISVFDDQSLAAGPAQGVEFALDLNNSTAHPVFQFGSPRSETSAATGSFRRYADGDSVVGWGVDFGFDGQTMSEVNAAGQDVLDLDFVANNQSYRVMKAPTGWYDINVLRATAGQ